MSDSMKNYIQNLWKKPHLAEILYFFEIFQYQKERIEQKHLRYFLMNNHHLDFVNKLNNYYKENKLFFEEFAPTKNDFQTRESIHQHLKKLDSIKDELEKEIQKRNFILSLWRNDNIKTEYDLDQYLRRLCRNNVIKKINKKKPYKYMTTNEYEKNFQELRMIEYIERWDTKEQNKIIPSQNNGYYINASIFGISVEHFTKDEVKKIALHLKNICENLTIILELKNKKTCSILEGQKETEREKLTSIDFFFHGSNFFKN